MATVTPKQALDVLRSVRGLRDAFMGFNHVVDALIPVIETLEIADETLKESTKTRDDLITEIALLDKKRLEYVTATETEREKFDKIRQRVKDLANALKIE